MQWKTDFFPGDKQPEREVHRFPPSAVFVHTVWLRVLYRSIFTLTFLFSLTDSQRLSNSMEKCHYQKQIVANVVE
jgi:hypothetical protein